MKRRLSAFFISIGIILGLAPIRVHAADGPALRIAYTSIGISYGPLWLTKEVGIFKKYDIDAELLFIAGGPLSTQALIAGDVSIAFASAVALISANLSGADLAILGATIDTLPFQLYAIPSVSGSV
jgi:ABC-type nitrate/sulfonate/bicarbonate transport system substrate-binding protein